MIQFLPKNLNLKELLTNNPPDFKYHIDHFVHLCSLLYELPAKKKDSLRKDGFVPINAHLLKKVNNNYKKYLNYLIKHGVIECDNSYIPGEKSKAYRFAPKYHDIIHPVNITKYTLTKNLKEVYRFNRDMYAKYSYFYKWFNEGLTVDFISAKQKLLELYLKDVDAKNKNALHKLNMNMVNLFKLDMKDYYFTVDSTSKRLHTLLTKIKKDVRPFITYENIQLANLDIQSSQPFLSLCLLDSSFYNTELKQERISINSIDPQLTETLPIHTIASYVLANQSKFENYRNLVFNDFYTGMAEILKQHAVTISDDKKIIKDMMYMVLYSSNKFLGGNQGLPKRIFKQVFPEVYEVFKMYKSAGQEKLPILLQKIESTLILDRAAKTIAKAEPGMPLFSIHDSLVVDAKKIDFCKDVIKRESIKYLGIEPKIHVDVWGAPHA
ncbi:MAG: hypothetical protein A3F72_03625 [Bacteroidetes bacterium RIFCSPLOWO2_12_FULL_35_15]|nr:MAG: hypothetical protein A3F72_03625 [Bacteroidetes bacterium RIFCSPLOWO2_12_FULL_35_15]